MERTASTPPEDRGLAREAIGLREVFFQWVTHMAPAAAVLCIEAANETELGRLERDRQQSERDDVALREHEAYVDDVADRLRFDQK